MQRRKNHDGLRLCAFASLRSSHGLSELRTEFHCPKSNAVLYNSAPGGGMAGAEDRFEDFLAGLKRGGPAPVTVLYGGDGHLRRKGLEVLLAAAPGADVVRVDAATADPARVRGDLFTPSLLGGRTVVVLSGPGDRIAPFREVIDEVLASPPAALLVCVIEGAAGKAKLPKGDASGRLARAACETPRRWELPRWVQGAAAAKGKKIAPDAAELLVERSGEDLGVLDGHLEKLCLYTGARPAIAAADVEAVVGRDREYDAFDLIRKTAAFRRREAMEILHRLFEQGVAPEMILGAMGWQVRRLLEGKALLREGKSPEAVGQAVKVYGKFLDEFLGMVREAREEDLVRRHGAVLRADAAVKRGRLPPELALEAMVLELCRRKTA